MENPYIKSPEGDEGVPGFGLRMTRLLGWEEGYTAGKAEQAEIVSELVEVMKTACLQLGIWGNTPSEWDYYNLIQWMKDSRTMLEGAIAKAKGA